MESSRYISGIAESSRIRVLDASEFERWREAADVARRGAEVQAAAALHNWACFLAEQAAQLAAKGLLHGIAAGAWGHDLVQMAEAIASASGDALPADTAAAARRLSRHYIPARYPDAHSSGSPGMHYGPEDADQALADLETLFGFVDGLWARLTKAAAKDRHGG